MIRPTALDHIVLRTDRYRELIDFYCDVLGCTVERTLSESFGLTQLRAGSALIDIVDVDVVGDEVDSGDVQSQLNDIKGQLAAAKDADPGERQALEGEAAWLEAQLRAKA